MKVLNTLRQKWPEYVLEVLVLIIGIYSAFALENWNENINDRNKTKTYLTSILANLKEDAIELSTLNAQNEVTIRRSAQLIEYYKQNDFVEDSATIFLSWLQMELNFNTNSSGMNALEGSGRLDLLPDQVAISLQEYYSICSDLVDRESISNRYIQQAFEPYFYDNFSQSFRVIDAYNIRKIYENDTRNPEYLTQADFTRDAKLEAYIVVRLVHSREQKKLYELLIAKNESIMRNVEESLKSL